MPVLLEKQNKNRASLRKQPTFGDATTGFPPVGGKRRNEFAEWHVAWLAE